MKFINKSEFWSQLKKHYPEYKGGWFYNCLEDAFGCPSLDISNRAKLETLIKKTNSIPLILGSSYPLLAFPNGNAGWKNLSSSRSQSPISVSDENELADLITKHIYFRDANRYEDNYHITNQEFEWFAVFCHHGDWHLFTSKKIMQKIRKRW
jgi:hypothetical protein